MAEEKRALGYICPECGKSVYGERTAFALSAAAVGLVCDLLLPSPFEGFYAIAFTLAALIAALIAENLLSPGFLCGLAVSAVSLGITAGMRLAVQFLSGGGYLGLMSRMALVETLITLPAILVVVPVYRLIHDRCASDY